jgi:hypothetical protein
MWERLRRFRALEGQAQCLFLRAAMALPLIRLSLRWRGFRATQTMLERLAAHRPALPAAPENCAVLTARMVKAAGRHGLRRASCLEESLALWWLLARQGMRTEIRIGVRNGPQSESEFAAHAWIEHNGVALNETEAPHRHYAAFESGFPRQRSSVE